MATEYYPDGKSVKELVERLESERGQSARPEQQLRIDVPLRLLPGDVFRLGRMAAYFGMRRRDLAERLLSAALYMAASELNEGLDPLDEEEYVKLLQNRDYYVRRIEAEHQSWRSEATAKEPEERDEETGEAPD